MIITLEVIYTSGKSAFFKEIATRNKSVDESIEFILKKNKLIEVPIKLARIFIRILNSETKLLIKEIYCSRSVFSKERITNITSEESNSFIVEEDIRFKDSVDGTK